MEEGYTVEEWLNSQPKEWRRIEIEAINECLRRNLPLNRMMIQTVARSLGTDEMSKFPVYFNRPISVPQEWEKLMMDDPEGVSLADWFRSQQLRERFYLEGLICNHLSELLPLSAKTLLAEVEELYQSVLSPKH